MSRKRSVVDAPTTDPDDPLVKILRVLNETLAARQSVAGASGEIRDCLQTAQTLHRMLLTANRNVDQRILDVSNEQASLLLLQNTLNSSANMRSSHALSDEADARAASRAVTPRERVCGVRAQAC